VSLAYPEAARIVREALKDKSYRAFPIGQEAGAYLRWKRGQIEPTTYRTYESCLDKLARAFPDLEIADFEPPVGVERLEEFMDAQWGESENRTYNKNLSMLKEFFKWAVLKSKLHGDPALPLRPRKKRDVYRTSFSSEVRQRIISEQAGDGDPLRLLRDRVALRLLLVYGLRKGALQKVQFKHFDHNRRRLTVFTKGSKVRELPIVEDAFWHDLGRYIVEWEAKPQEYLLCREKMLFRGYDRETGDAKMVRWQYRDDPMGTHGLHNWWYRCLEAAGIVAKGQTSGEKMHKARHTAGQLVLDKTGNLKAAQKLLGHSSIQVTGDSYTDWDIGQLEATMREVSDE